MSLGHASCRLCGARLTCSFVDLGMSPLCESYLAADQIDAPETFYPLHVRLCDKCLLVQLPAHVSGEHIFSDYAYFSSYSTTWVAHAKQYANEMTAKLGLTADSLVTEVASNDGYLLQHFQEAGIPVLGVEPARNVAAAAIAKGIRSVVKFLGAETGDEIAREYGKADLVAANNVFAHVPDIRGFAVGLRALVKETGLVTLEFPHLLRLIQRRQYDTIYHEHFSYLSLLTSSRALDTAGLWRGRRRGTADARWQPAGLCPARRRWRVSRQPTSKPCSTWRRPSACTLWKGTRGSPPRYSGSRATCLRSCSPRWLRARRWRGTGRLGRGIRC